MAITLVSNVSIHVEVDADRREIPSVKVADEHAEGPVLAPDADVEDGVEIA